MVGTSILGSWVGHQTHKQCLWAKELRLDEKREFDEGDLGLAGGSLFWDAGKAAGCFFCINTVITI
jgi:hypothetical protein